MSSNHRPTSVFIRLLCITNAVRHFVNKRICYVMSVQIFQNDTLTMANLLLRLINPVLLGTSTTWPRVLGDHRYII